MNWLRNLRLQSVAKRYALRLPGYLRSAYSASEFYTTPQIAHAVKALKLPLQYIGLAYAVYLPRSAYDAVSPGLSLRLTYEDARAEFYRHVPEPEEPWNPQGAPSVSGIPYSK
jgi:hypothetical protein